MNYKTFIIVSIACLCALFSFAQNYTVSNFQKINELTGNFTGSLDVNDNFGVSIAQIGDLDGNGVTDFAVGAFNDDDGGTNSGAVWILFMDANDQVISHTKISSTSGNFTGDLDPNDGFGVSVAYLGDLNSDGLIELAVGATYDGDGGFWHGAVWILSLNSDGTVNSHSKISDTQGGFTGFINGDAVFGTDIENIGDLNGDGIEDLAVGSRRDADGGSRRGAVWILFMNADFTVNSFQKISDTQGNFTAILEFEDYFGGSIVNVGDLDQDGVTDIVVSAYRDDDQIINSGSFYVLFLNADGTVKGYQKVSNSEGGLNGIISNGALFGRMIDGVVDIDNDGKVEILVGALGQLNPTQMNQTGAIYLIELNSDGTVSEEYMYTFGENCFGGVLENGDFFGGSVAVWNDAGTYHFAIGAYKDSDTGTDKGAVWILELGAQFYNVVGSQDPTDCATDNGEITIGNLDPNSTYNITYEMDGNPIMTTMTSDLNGMFVLAGLSAGNYTNISVTNTATNCLATVNDVTLNGVSFDVNFTTQIPSACGASDGSISLSNLVTSNTYQITYSLNGNSVNLNLNANTSGEIVLTNLLGGTYTSFTVLDTSSNCEDVLGDIFIAEPVFLLNFTASMTSTCGASDGTILISNLTPNQEYVVDYFYESNQVQNIYNANATGEIVLTGLTAGLYEFIMVVDTLAPCTDGIGQILIENAAFTVTPSSTNPSSCNASDGSIIFEDATANEAYTITYILNGTTITANINSDASGTLLLTNLGIGLYEAIVVEEVATNCVTTIADILLENTNFSVTPSSTNPSSCNVSDGSIIFEDATANEAYTITYILNGTTTTANINSDASGTLLLTNLGIGLYEAIVVEEVATNCVTTIADILLENPSFSVTPSSTNPSSCNVSDGSIIFEGVTANEVYTVSYTFNTETITATILSDNQGVITVGNLAFGIYADITLIEDNSGCMAIFSFLELTCVQEIDACFQVRRFFTPNADGFNDVWQLENVQNCNYFVYIYDRYGKNITILTPNFPTWDGTYKGNKLPSSDYWISIKYVQNGQELEYITHITLKR
ncbi:FG-GAP repeat protein [Kordia sp. SMS9]|uniref:T9SS type B sorting domain-containing protein n=1 Tax=Kordia sp. SMS9 TaxID=2282170 RepID=UPI000E0DA63F|nr:T9SS type B sorting domain-containing protein [Kordia sp. SMS9]AXG71047.1 FG-GAP repeat protein [Kordia sp. SMS9]